MTADTAETMRRLEETADAAMVGWAKAATEVERLTAERNRLRRDVVDARDELATMKADRDAKHSDAAEAMVELVGSQLRAEDAERDRDKARAALDRVRALHRGLRIYDECGHKHEAPDTVLGIQDVPDVGLVCADGYMYTICAECCRDGDYQSEHCANDHSHTVCHPCPTIAALDGSGT